MTGCDIFGIMMSDHKGGDVMKSFEPKKLAIVRILQILEQNTDSEHPMTQEEIAKRLLSDYDISFERKAVGRCISLLQAAGYDVETTQKGSYMNSRLFEDSELRLLSDSVLASRHITATHSRQLIEKLSQLSSRYFRSHVKNVYSVSDWNKSENAALFYNIEVVDEAITAKKQIKFTYNKYGADKKLHYAAIHIASPFQMILHNQRYYLMAYEEKWKSIRYFRMDKITQISLQDEPATDIRTISGYQNGIDYKRFSSGMPYMYSDEPESISFSIDGEWMIDQIVDWFGFDFSTVKSGNQMIVTVKASLYAMEYWAMQYLNHVEVLSPENLRRKIADNVRAANQKYEGA